MRRLAEAESAALEIDSAGTGDWHIGHAPDPRAQAEALRRGLDISMLRARQVTEEDFHRFDHIVAMEVCLEVIAGHADKVDGVKISLLDKQKELVMRRRLPAGVRTYSGDDFNYPELIAGDEAGHSDALLGIFDAIAPAAAAALGALAQGDVAGFHDILAPTVPLSRHIFRAPTRFYKTGVVFLAYLNGLQHHFIMVGGQQSARSLVHLAELFRLADAAGLLADPDLAAARMQRVLAVHGIAN